jgi:protein-L-isoaspartate(D-aspartate) O-methyltransferase
MAGTPPETRRRAMADAALQRKNMVESQVRTSDVTDRRITAAMTVVPREKFVPDRLETFAYSDGNLLISEGSAMLAPSTLAKLLQLAELQAGDNVLVVGGYCGYAAAIVAQIAAKVVALLPDAAAAAAVTRACSELGFGNIRAVDGPLASGCQENAPYGVIVIEGGVETVPEVLAAQLADGGRLVAIEMDRGLGRAFLLHKKAGFVARRDAFQAAAHLLGGFEALKPSFVF